jgi:GTPase
LADDKNTDIQTPDSEQTRCGYVAIVGAPNTGKSTLMNALIGERLSIVTPKPHTTRNRVLGIITDPNVQAQVIFLDTPGLILKPRYRLQEAMVGQIDRSLVDCDVVLALLDYERPEPSLIGMIDKFVEKSGKPAVYVLNKVDLAKEEVDLSEYPEGTLAISALQHLNLGALGVAITEHLPVGPYLYPPDSISDQPERFFVAEFIRETIFDEMRMEIPYTTAVSIDDFTERKPKDFIRATILVDRESQKGIMIGKNAVQLKRIGQLSRQKIEEFLGREVYLELHVGVKRDWMKKDASLRDLGYLDK